VTDEKRKEEGAEEQIEDLEAPAAAQQDVVGGACIDYTHRWCMGETCKDTTCEAGAGGGPSFVIRVRSA
jgi:hypothetical protein